MPTVVIVEFWVILAGRTIKHGTMLNHGAMQNRCGVVMKFSMVW